MAEHQDSFEFTAVEAKDIVEDRQAEWLRFTQFVTWGIGATVLLLVALFVFVV